MTGILDPCAGPRPLAVHKGRVHALDDAQGNGRFTGRQSIRQQYFLAEPANRRCSGDAEFVKSAGNVHGLPTGDVQFYCRPVLFLANIIFVVPVADEIPIFGRALGFQAVHFG